MAAAVCSITGRSPFVNYSEVITRLRLPRPMAGLPDLAGEPGRGWATPKGQCPPPIRSGLRVHTEQVIPRAVPHASR